MNQLNAAKKPRKEGQRSLAGSCSRQQSVVDSKPDRRLADDNNATNDSIHDYIPQYLRRFVAPYHGDFCFTPIFDARLISSLMAEGFLPIATEGFLLPKLHEERCVIRLDQEALHTSKSTRKKAKRYQLTVNTSFRRVVEACRQQHGETCWLYEPLVQAFETIHSNVSNAANVYNARTHQVEPCPVRLYSIEVWNEQRELVAGELGYTVGSMYTSLTGFRFEDGAGSVQLAALGHLLIANGFTVWDLGMDMAYKQHLGTSLIKRADFVRLVHRLRHEFGHNFLPLNNGDPYDCRSLIDSTKTKRST
ncbi:hypothetical protein MPSEU_000805000 [Mayamaea pseudoterrestris]|nr:hypothetical protein MPSEU_000805000 [Mayamaea pseudoterrestris]